MHTLTVLVFGIVAYPRIGVDQYPDVDFPVVTVLTILPGADPETIEKTVTEPLEEALNTGPGLATLRSLNVESVSQIIVEFDLGRNVDVAAQDVRDKVQATLAKLPREIQSPVVQKFDIGAIPVVTLAFSSKLPIERLTKIADDVVKPSLQQIQGVGSVDLLGGRKREITAVIDPALAKGYGLFPADVVQGIRGQSIDVPGGRTLEPGVERSVKLAGEARSVEALRALVVASPGGVPVRLGQVAQVLDGPAEARSSAQLGDQSAVGLIVRKQSGGNTVQVAGAVREALATIEAQLPPGSRIAVVIDGAQFIRSSISAVQEDMILGGLLAVLVVLLFLRNWRSTLVSAVALPTAIIGTFAVMRALGFTFNVITMLALTLSIGLLIDDAIVVIENIIRHLEHGEKPWEAARKGTSEIALAAIERALGSLDHVYRRALGWVLSHRVWTMVGATVVLVLTFGLATQLKATFLPQQDMSLVKVTLELPTGTALEETRAQLSDLSRQIRAVPGVTETFAVAGGGQLEEVNKGDITVSLVPIKERAYGQQDFKAFLRANL